MTPEKRLEEKRRAKFVKEFLMANDSAVPPWQSVFVDSYQSVLRILLSPRITISPAWKSVYRMTVVRTSIDTAYDIGSRFRDKFHSENVRFSLSKIRKSCARKGWMRN